MKSTYPNLRSSTNEVGESVTQIIHFKSGEKRTYHGLLTSSIKQGQFTKFRTKDGNMIMINDREVLVIEVFPEN